MDLSLVLTLVEDWTLRIWGVDIENLKVGMEEDCRYK